MYLSCCLSVLLVIYSVYTFLHLPLALSTPVVSTTIAMPVVTRADTIIGVEEQSGKTPEQNGKFSFVPHT